MAACFRTLSSSSWLHLGAPNLTAFLQDWTHQSMSSRTFIWGRNQCGSERSLYIPERGHNWLIKLSILFYSNREQMHDCWHLVVTSASAGLSICGSPGRPAMMMMIIIIMIITTTIIAVFTRNMGDLLTVLALNIETILLPINASKNCWITGRENSD